MKLSFENRTFAAFLFAVLLATVVLFFQCCKSEPAERILRNQQPGVLKFKPAYEYLFENVVIQLDSSKKIVQKTDPYDNRYSRKNGFFYSEQMNWKGLYFTDICQKQQFDYKRIHGSELPDDSLISHIIASDTVLSEQYILHAVYGSYYTVEKLDFFIESGQLSDYAEKVK